MTIEFNWEGAEDWPTITIDEALADVENWPDPDGLWIWGDEKGTEDHD